MYEFRIVKKYIGRIGIVMCEEDLEIRGGHTKSLDLECYFYQ